MPTQLPQPAAGEKLSEKPIIPALAGEELLPALRPKAGNPSSYENINLPAELFTNSQAHPLDYAQGTLLPQGKVTPTLYALTGAWNAGPDATVYVRGIGAASFDPDGLLLNADGSLTRVTVDVAAGTYALPVPVGAPQWVAGPQTGGALVYDAGAVYRVKQDIANSQTAPGANPANYEFIGSEQLPQDVQTLQTTVSAHGTTLQQHTQQLADSYTKTQADGRFATPAQIAAVVGAAPAALDTLAEIAAQLAQDEAGAAAILATQQQHTQQLTQLAARGGRNRGPWAANTAYQQYDWVLQAGLTYYAKQDFTSGSSFAASNWQQFGAGLTPAQVQALNPLTYAVMAAGGNVGNSYKGFASIAEAQDFSPAVLVLNILNHTITTDIDFGATKIFSNGGTIALADGATVTFSPLSVVYRTNISLTGTQRTGRITVEGGSAPTAIGTQFIDCTIGATLDDGGLAYYLVGRGNSKFSSVVAGSKVRLYDLSSATSSGAITVDDKRPGTGGGGSGATYTAGTGIAISPQNVISATGIDYQNEVELTQATTLDATAFYKAYRLAGSGFTVQLPSAAAHAGKLLFVRVRSSATGLYTLQAASGESINGEASRALWSQEAVLLEATAQGWAKMGGKPRPMYCEVWLDQAQAVGAQSVGVFAFAITHKEASSGGMSNGRGITFPRKGLWTVRGYLNAATPSNYTAFALLLNNNSVPGDGTTFAPNYTANGNYSAQVLNILNAQPGDTVGLGLYLPNQGDAAQVVGYDANNPQNTTRLTVLETPDW